MRQLPVHERLRNDADSFAASAENGVGKDTHQADIAAPEDEPQAAPDKRLAQLPRCRAVDGFGSRAGPAKNTEPLQLHPSRARVE